MFESSLSGCAQGSAAGQHPCTACYWTTRQQKERAGQVIWGRARRCTSRSPLRSSTRPATERSRSNQVCHRPPPYVSTASIWKPGLSPLDTGFSFRHGLRGTRHGVGCLVRKRGGRPHSTYFCTRRCEGHRYLSKTSLCPLVTRCCLRWLSNVHCKSASQHDGRCAGRERAVGSWHLSVWAPSMWKPLPGR